MVNHSSTSERLLLYGMLGPRSSGKYSGDHALDKSNISVPEPAWDSAAYHYASEPR